MRQGRREGQSGTLGGTGHALAAPIIFATVSFLYFHRLGSWPPIRTAAALEGVEVVMDVVVAAFLIKRSFEMLFGGRWSVAAIGVKRVLQQLS